MSGSEVPGSEVAEVILTPPQDTIDDDMADACDDKKYREWVFTINNPTDDDTERLENLQCRYLVYGPEVGKKGTPHYQGYVVLRNQRYLKGLKKLLPRAWLAPRSPKSSPKQARQYIVGPWSNGKKSKPANPDVIERGEIPEQGKRNDIQKLNQDIRLGKRGRPLWEEHSVVCAKYPKYVDQMVRFDDEERAMVQYESGQKPYVAVLWGDSDCGKTRYAYDKHGCRNIYKHKCGDGSKGAIWFDNYHGQPVIILDDFVGQIPLTYLFQLLDRYPTFMQVKGSTVWRLATHIYITSNKPPEEWYPLEPQQRVALFRRFDDIVHITDPDP